MAAQDYSGVYESAGKTWNVDPRLLQAIAQQESGQRTTDAQGRLLTSPAGAQGVMQFIPSTARRYGVDVTDPVSSINGAAHYLHDLLAQTKGDVAQALALYGGDRSPNQTYGNAVAANYARLQGNPIIAQRTQTAAGQGGLGTQLLGGPAPGQDGGQGAQPATPALGTQLLGTPAGQALKGGEDMVPQPGAPVAAHDVAPGTEWLARNVETPLRQIMDPTQVPPGQAPAPLLGMPALSTAGAGLVQGMRDLGQSINNAAAWVDQRMPWLSDVDRWAVKQGLLSSPQQGQQTLGAQTKAAEQQYGGDLLFGAGRVASPIIAGSAGVIPGVGGMMSGGVMGGVGTGARLSTRALLGGGEVIPAAAEGAAVGGVSNLLTSPEQDPATALLTGTVGGAAVGGAMNRLLGPRGGIGQDAARRLGLPLSAGQQGNTVAKNVEDLSKYLPGSGAEALQLEQNQGIARVLGQQMGMRGMTELTPRTVFQAERAAGQLMDQAQNINIIGRANIPLMTNLANIVQAANRGVETQRIPRFVNDQILNVMMANNGVLPGTQLHQLIARGGILDNLAGGGTMGEKYFAGQIRDALMNAATNPANQAAPDALRLFQLGRYRYKVAKTIEDYVGQAGSTATDRFSVQNLANAIWREFGRDNPRFFFPGADPMADLYYAIKGPLAELKSSGTGRQLLWQRLLGLGGLGATEGGAHFLQHMLPQYIDPYLTYTAVPAAGLVAAGRISRFGVPNYLMPQLLGPAAGSAITGQPAQ